MDKYLKDPSLFLELTENETNKEEVEDLFRTFVKDYEYLKINSIYVNVTNDFDVSVTEMNNAYGEVSDYLNGKHGTSYEKAVLMFKLFLYAYNRDKKLHDMIKFRYDHRLTYFYKDELYDADLDKLTVNGLIDLPDKMTAYHNLISKSTSDQIEISTCVYKSKMELLTEIYYGERHLEDLARQLLEQLWFVKILADGWDKQVQEGSKTYEEAPIYIRAYNELINLYYKSSSIRFIHDVYDIVSMQAGIINYSLMMRKAIIPIFATYKEITSVIDRELTLFRESKEKEQDEVHALSNDVYSSVLTIDTGIKEIGTLAVEFNYYNMITNNLLNDRSIISQLHRLAWLSRELMQEEHTLVSKNEYQTLINDSNAILTAFFAREDIEELFCKMDQCYSNGVYKNYLDAKRGKEIVYKYVKEHLSNWQDDDLIIEDRAEAMFRTRLFTDIANELKYIFKKLSLVRIGDPFTLIRKL